MDKYISFLNPSKIKLEFLFELFLIFSPDNKQIAQRNWNYIYLKNGHELHWNSFNGGRKHLIKNENGSYRECSSLREVLNLTETQYALIDKVEHILFYRSGLKDVIIMLNSFSRGTKRLRSNHDKNDRGYEWTYKDGNEKRSHSGNLTKAHFRWNFGERYTLTETDLKLVSEFIKPLVKHL